MSDNPAENIRKAVDGLAFEIARRACVDLARTKGNGEVYSLPGDLAAVHRGTRQAATSRMIIENCARKVLLDYLLGDFNPTVLENRAIRGMV